MDEVWHDFDRRQIHNGLVKNERQHHSLNHLHMCFMSSFKWFSCFTFIAPSLSAFISKSFPFTVVPRGQRVCTQNLPKCYNKWRQMHDLAVSVVFNEMLCVIIPPQRGLILLETTIKPEFGLSSQNYAFYSVLIITQLPWILNSDWSAMANNKVNITIYFLRSGTG